MIYYHLQISNVFKNSSAPGGVALQSEGFGAIYTEAPSYTCCIRLALNAVLV